MPASQRKYFADDLVGVIELDTSDVFRSVPKDTSCLPPSRETTALERCKGLLRLFACIYAAIMIIVLVGLHIRDERYVGMQEFFVSCTAGFYIICYQFLAAKDGIKRWFKQNGSTFRAASIALAALIVSIPMTFLLRQQTGTRSTPSFPKPSAMTEVPALVAHASVPSLAQAQHKSVSTPGAVEKPARPGVVFDIRYTSDFTSAVVIVDLDQETQFEVHRISSPERIYLDLQNTELAPVLLEKKIQTQDGLLRVIRVGEHERKTTRITLATAQICDYSVTRVPNSSQLRIELRKAQAQARRQMRQDSQEINA